MDRTMDQDAFESALDRYGPELRRWPDAAAAQASSLIDSSARARALLAEARELESALDDALTAGPAPFGLETRLLANLPRREAWIEWLTIKTWRPVCLAFVPLLAGFGIGVNFAEDPADFEQDALVALFDPGEISRLALPGDESSVEP